jgi:hypothetical protein
MRQDDERKKKMKRNLWLIPILFTHSCAGFTPMMEDVKEIANNDAITIKCDRDTFQKNTDLHLVLDVVNKDPLK